MFVGRAEHVRGGSGSTRWVSVVFRPFVLRQAAQQAAHFARRPFTRGGAYDLRRHIRRHARHVARKKSYLLSCELVCPEGLTMREGMNISSTSSTTATLALSIVHSVNYQPMWAASSGIDGERADTTKRASGRGHVEFEAQKKYHSVPKYRTRNTLIKYQYTIGPYISVQSGAHICFPW